MLEKLKGKKTYITGTLAVLAAVGGFLSGDIELGPCLQAVLTAVLGMTIRNGLK